MENPPTLHGYPSSFPLRELVPGATCAWNVLELHSTSTPCTAWSGKWNSTFHGIVAFYTVLLSMVSPQLFQLTSDRLEGCALARPTAPEVGAGGLVMGERKERWGIGGIGSIVGVMGTTRRIHLSLYDSSTAWDAYKTQYEMLTNLNGWYEG